VNVLKILVVVPTWGAGWGLAGNGAGRAKFLLEALSSLARQTRRADCLVVTGNVMPDQDCSRCAFDVRLDLNDLPLSVRINKAVAETDCDAFLVLCDDDKLAPMYIEKTAAAMESDPDVVDVVYTGQRWFGDMSLLRNRSVLPITNAPHISSLVSKRAWKLAGGFRDVPHQDQDFWYACKASGCGEDGWVWIQEPLFLYRIHDRQFSEQVTGQDQQRYMAAIQAKHGKT
jgi:hypothetical protein